MNTYRLTRLEEFGWFYQDLGRHLLATQPEERVKWQQMIVEGSTAHQTHELSNVVLNIPDVSHETVVWRLGELTGADLPWAEDHFQERVGGEPINPGTAHSYWPYHGHSIQEHLRKMGETGQYYDHNYMERMWARGLTFSTLEPMEATFLGPDGEELGSKEIPVPFTGYRFDVGDLGDVVNLLKQEPSTRQAYLPIWFPEDTGVTSAQRVPCTLGYYFIRKNGKLEMTYFLRACEWYRHFRNDVYLAIRLQQWVAEQVEMEAGQFTMHVGNMHLFRGDAHRVKP